MEGVFLGSYWAYCLYFFFYLFLIAICFMDIGELLNRLPKSIPNLLQPENTLPL
jgi:hypothetical protein